MLLHKQCPKCIAYIHDTLQYPLSPSHRFKDSIHYKSLSLIRVELAGTMERIVKDYFGHKNLVFRIIHDHREEFGASVPLNYKKIFDSIVQWYTYLYCDLKEKKNQKRKHPFQVEIEFLCILAVEAGCVRGKKSDPLFIFQEWLMEYYVYFLEHLDLFHTEHTAVPTKIWDRTSLDTVYD